MITSDVDDYPITWQVALKSEWIREDAVFIGHITTFLYCYTKLFV